MSGVLSDPSCVFAGQLLRVHPNGRINYEGFPTRADGADEDAEAAMEAEAEAQAAEARGAGGSRHLGGPYKADRSRRRVLRAKIQ